MSAQTRHAHPALMAGLSVAEQGLSVRPWPREGAAAVAGLVRQAGGSRLLRYVLLWAALALGTAVVVAVPQLPVAAHNPLLSVAVATIAAVVGIALLQLGLLRFTFLGHPLDLCAGLAFGTLAFTNLAVGVVGPVAAAPAELEPGLYLVLLHRTAAAALFLVGLVGWRQVVPAGARARFAAKRAGAVVVALALGHMAMRLAGPNLPSAVDARARDVIEAGSPIVDVLPGQALLLVLASSAIAALLLLATVGYVALTRRLGDPHLGAVATALALLFFSQLQTLLFPPVSVEYVSTADAFRLGAYLVLLFSLVMRIRGEIVERASGEERLRLSRELHDGLAQQLGLLNLRLNRAVSPYRTAADRARDLAAAQRLVEAALLEARQAITTLRTGTASWAELTHGLATFAGEFAQNHEVEVRVCTKGALSPVEAQLGTELLRIVHEALSNAVRHGGATCVEIILTGEHDGLELAVRDNGRGFDPDGLASETGVGLRSMRERLERRGGVLLIDSAPGQGATVRAWLPLGR